MQWRDIRFVAVAFVATACGDDNLVCDAIPTCAPGAAVIVSVTGVGGAPNPVGAYVTTSTLGAALPCTESPGNVCTVNGAAGTYELTIGAPGYTTVHKTVSVTSTPHPCGCDAVNTQHVDVALTIAVQIALR